MKMKSLILFAMLSGQISIAAAESTFWNRANINQDTPEIAFNESQLSLPDVPDPNQGDWYEMYVSPTFTGKPRILLSSIQTAEDGSIRYLLNNRSAQGLDNITAEGILCVTGNKLFSSDGAQVKTFGFADTVNNRWITPRKSAWKVIGGKFNSNDPVRLVLYEGFCVNGKASSDDELRKRIQDAGSLRRKIDY